LPQGRLHGWYPGAYLGHPLLLYYFPLPFLLMSALAPLVGLPVAFKIGTALPVFLMPWLAYASFRLMGFRSPGPLMGATGTVVFLFVEDNPIWGGTLASTLAGEFSYTYGAGLAVLFLGALYRAYGRGARPWLPAALLALTALAHGYAVLWAGCSAAFFLFGARRPWRALGWLASVAALGFAFAGFFLVPLLAGWRWTTPYDDPWITVAWRNLLPPLLWPLFAAALMGLAWSLVEGRRSGGLDRRLLFLLHSALAAVVLALAAPGFGVIDVRLVPFAQLALALGGAASIGMVAERLAAPRLAALGLVLLALAYAGNLSQVARSWALWNYTGLEAKQNWPAFRELADTLRGGAGDPRVAVEYSSEHEKVGSIRVYETLPFFSGRSTLEGVYNQAGLTAHAVYYLASELSERSPNPYRSREYASFDTDAALGHLRLFQAREIVSLGSRLSEALDARADVERVARIGNYTVHRLRDGRFGECAPPGFSYVEPLCFAPVRSSPSGWREKSYRWFVRRPAARALLVFTGDEHFATVERDEWLAPPEAPLPGAGAVRVAASLEAERLTVTTDRIGHPVLVKVAYHPRWRADGADGPYLVSPGLMVIVPRRAHVVLTYAGRDWSDFTGLALTLGACALAVLAGRRPRVVPVAHASQRLSCDGLPEPPRRWGGLVALGLALLLLAPRLWPADRPRAEAAELRRRALAARSDGRHADAAEYLGHELARTSGRAERGELLCLRGESLLAAGRAGEAAAAFERVVGGDGDPAHVARALDGAARAREQAGDATSAAEHRKRLAGEFPD
jgi:hypothetical protein